MHKIFLAIALLSLGGCNAAYNEAVNQAVGRRLSDGFKIPCRPASPDVPAITIDAPDGQQAGLQRSSRK